MGAISVLEKSVCVCVGKMLQDACSEECVCGVLELRSILKRKRESEDFKQQKDYKTHYKSRGDFRDFV